MSRSFPGAPRPGFHMLLALVSVGASTATAHPEALAQRLDSIAGAGVLDKRAVGIVAAVVRGKDMLLLKAYGRSDVDGDAPMITDTILPIGSTTKQFTAAAILQLRDQGKLSLDDVYKVIHRYPFQFPTGTMEIYSNSNFWLLGLIIEKASAYSAARHGKAECGHFLAVADQEETGGEDRVVPRFAFQSSDFGEFGEP